MLAPATEHHVNDAKAPTNDESAPEQSLNLFGCGVGGHVKILGCQSDHQVTHRATNDVGLKTRVLERSHHVDGIFIDQSDINAVHAGRNFLSLAKLFFIRICRSFSE